MSKDLMVKKVGVIRLQALMFKIFEEIEISLVNMNPMEKEMKIYSNQKLQFMAR